MSICLILKGVTPEAYTSLAEGDWSGFRPTRMDESVDKDWRGLQVLFCGPEQGAPGLEGVALVGGIPVDDPSEEDYGGAFVLSPRLVRMIATRLDETDDEDLRNECTRIQWGKTYYGGMPAQAIEEAVVRAFGYLRDFFAECAEAGEGVLRFYG